MIGFVFFIFCIVLVFGVFCIGSWKDDDDKDGSQGGGTFHQPSGKENEDKEVDDGRLSD